MFINLDLIQKQMSRTPFSFRLYFVVLSIFLIEAYSIVDNNITRPKIYLNKQLPIQRIQAQNHYFSIKFPTIDYQISGAVYETSNTLEMDTIYNISNYNISTNCKFYKTNVGLQMLKSIDLDYISQHSVIDQKNHLIYIVGYYESSDLSEPFQKFVKVYQFNHLSIKQYGMVTLDNSITLKSGFEYNLFLLNLNSATLLSDGDALYQIKITNGKHLQLSAVAGLKSNQNTEDYDFLGMSCKCNDQIIFLYENKVSIYNFTSKNGSSKVQLSLQIKKDDKLIYDVEANSKFIFVLTNNILRIYPRHNSTVSKNIEIEGTSCSRIYVENSTIQLICSYQQMVYIAEYLYDSQKQTITLNRYYNELKDYRFMQFFGQNNNKIFMVGQDQIILTNFAVNRQVLLDLGNQTGNSQKIYSFGVQKVQTIREYSQKLNFISIGVSQNVLVLLRFTQVPPQIQCTIGNKVNSSYLNLLVATNTSLCDFNQYQASLESICTNLQPIKIQIMQIEIQKKMTALVIALIVITVLITILCFLGCVFNINLSHKKLIQKIRSQIKKIKQGNKQLKKI